VQNKKPIVIIFFIFFLLRFFGIQFGLPYEGLHPTESFTVSQSIEYLSGHSFIPRDFQHPNLFQYLTTFFSFLLGINPLQYPYIYIIARMISCFASFLSVYFLYRLASEIFSSNALGVLSASLLGFNLLSIKYAHYATPDSLALMFIVLALSWSWRLMCSPSMKNYILAGVFSGLSVSAKFSGLMAVTFILCAHFLSSKRRGSGLISAILASFFVFFLLDPYQIIFIKRAVSDYSIYFGQKGYFAFTCFKVSGFFNYPFKIIPSVFGFTGFLCALAGCIVLYFKRRSLAILLIIPFLAYFLALGVESGASLQNSLLLLPFLSIFCALFCVRFIEKRYLFWFLLGLIIVPQFIGAGIFDYFMLFRDTRVTAEEWILKNLPAGSKIGFERYTPYDLSLAGKKATDTAFESIFFHPSLSDNPAQYYRQEGFDYIISSSFRQDSYDSFCRNSGACEEKENYVSFEKEFSLVKLFLPPPIFRSTAFSLPWGTWPHNPVVKVYKIRS